jgi:hypothetical protein
MSTPRFSAGCKVPEATARPAKIEVMKMVFMFVSLRVDRDE